MKTDWARFVRAVVHGQYFLKAFESEYQGAGLYRASDAAGKDADVHLLSADADNAAAFEEHWSATASLSHPGLVQTLAFGTVRIDGAEFLCAVSESPEERLADVLAVRSLTADETREVLESTLAALEYLHHQKYLHGGYTVENIVACDGQAKLTTATIRRFSRSNPEDQAAFRQEIRQVGDCALRMLSQPGSRVPASIPPEFTMLLRTASMGDERWSPTAVDLVHALKGVNIQPKEPAAPPDEEASASTPVPAPEIEVAPSPTVETRTYERPPAASESVTAVPPSEPRRHRRGLIPVLALVAVVATFIYIAWPTPRVAGVSEPSPRAESPVRARSTAPVAPKATQQVAPAAETQKAVPAEGWAVVAATYKDRKAATRRAEQLARKWRASKLEVLPPYDGARRYLVVLGSGLSQAEANRLRAQAASRGMPRDSYVTKLSW